MVAISIIVPVYNSEEYLKECLKSLCEQTFKNLEIIIVNDGSVDDSQNIIDYYSSIDKRIVSIYQENSGPGEARNKGISKAQGKYIGFVDSDDIIEKNMYEKMYQLAEKNNYDIVSCNFANIYETGKVSNPIYRINKEVVYLEKYGLSNFLRSDIDNYRFGSEVWSKILRREIIEINNIYFKSHKEVLGEDILFLFEYLLYSKSIAYINEPLYYHRYRIGSLTNSPRPNMMKRLLKLAKTYEILAYSNGKKNEIAEGLPFIIYSFIGQAVSNEKTFNEKKNCILEVIDDKLIIESMSSIYKSQDSTIIKKIIAYSIIKKRINVYLILRYIVETLAKVTYK